MLKSAFLGKSEPVASWSRTTSAPKRLMSCQDDLRRFTFHERTVRVLGVSVTPQIYEHGVTGLGNAQGNASCHIRAIPLDG